MKYQIKNRTFLRKVLWLDFGMGVLTGLPGLIFSHTFASLFGLPQGFIVLISIFNLLYCAGALSLAVKKITPIHWLMILILANGAWTILSIVFVYFHFEDATVLGKVFLILQIILVGGLAYIEANQLRQIEAAVQG